MKNLLSFAKELRQSYTEKTPESRTPDHLSEIKSIKIPSLHDDYDIPVDFYYPTNITDKNVPVIVFAHGGAFVSGDLQTHHVLAHTIAYETQSIVAYVDYRLSPEHPYPTGLNDYTSVIDWIYKNSDSLGINPKKIALCGDSAGANLAATASMVARDQLSVPIVAQWLIYLYMANTEANTNSWRELGDTYFPTKEVFTLSKEAYLPEEKNQNLEYAAPLLGNHKNLPPALIQVGTLDPLIDENIKYNEVLQNSGVESTIKVYENQVHGFIQFFKNEKENPKGLEAVKDGIEFLNKIFH